MKEGAYDYLFKPLDLAGLRGVVVPALELGRQMREPAVVTQSLPAENGAIIGRCPAMGEVYKAIGRVAAQNAIALITGESGTGKELVARAIYQHRTRARAPFLAINCAAIPENLLESELFGHEKGAFTGTDRKRIGKFEQCNGGTLFRDEIGDMPLATQAKILVQLGLLDPSGLPVAGVETARKTLNPHLPSNELILQATARQGTQLLAGETPRTVSRVVGPAEASEWHWTVKTGSPTALPMTGPAWRRFIVCQLSRRPGNRASL
jgi:two-component system nitrogen regulation response regulator GlnG